MKRYYAKLKSPLVDYNEVYSKLIARADELPWYSSNDTYSFKLIKVQRDYIDNNPALSKIDSQFKMTPYIFKIPANTCYNWHVDADRGLAINLPLNNHSQSFTCFMTDSKYSEMSSIHYLKYDPSYFYLLNTQNYHSVLNLNEDRYFFSLTFEKNKSQLSYNDVLNFCIKEDLLIL